MKARNQTLQEIWIKSFLLVTLFIVIAAGMSSCNGDTSECLGVCPEDIDLVTEVYAEENLEEQSNLQYGTNSQNQTDFIKAKNTPLDDAPLVILVTGGGLVRWTQEASLRGMANHFAKRGYAAAIVKHRIINNPGNEISDEVYFDAWAKALQDVFTAIRFYKENATDFGIDPNRIIIGGWSTGAVVALKAAFLTEEKLENSDLIISTELRPAFDNIGGMYGDLYPNQTNEVAGLLALMPFTWEIDIIDNYDIPIMMINHEDAAFSNGTNVIGEFSIGEYAGWGTDPIFDKAMEVGYTEGNDLEYIKSNYHNGQDDFSPNVWVLTSENWPAIVDFFAPHMR